MSVCGIDYSSRAVDVVLLDEDTDAAEWHRFELEGEDAFDRSRQVRERCFTRSWWTDSPVIAVGIEDPRGYGSGSLYRVQGAILATIPTHLLVHPWVPSAWRKAVGLSGRASKQEVAEWATWKGGLGSKAVFWPQDACDAYCIALATRVAIQVTA